MSISDKSKRTSIRVITEEQLQDGINKAILKFQRIVELHSHPGGRLRKVWDFIKENGPCTYRDVAFLFDIGSIGLFMASTRLQYLSDHGWLEAVGRDKPMPRGRIAPLPYGALLYVAKQAPEHRFIAIARNKLYLEVDRLLNLGKRVPACLATRVDEKCGFGEKERYCHQGQISRNQDIVAARLEGFSLEEIGGWYGITRERTRQIIARALKL